MRFAWHINKTNHNKNLLISVSVLSLKAGGEVEGLLLEVLNQVDPSPSQSSIPPTIHENLSADMDEVSGDIFNAKPISEAKFIEKYDKASENVGEEDRILLYQMKEDSIFDSRTLEGYAPVSPATSSHSLYKPQITSYQNDSEDSDFIPGK